jgi:HNH endonuclease
MSRTILQTKSCEYKDCGLPFFITSKRKTQKFCSLQCYWLNKILPVVKFHRQKRIDGKKVYVHRYTYEQTTGKQLKKGEIVHHLNDNFLDNRPENLNKLDSQSRHMREHYKEKSGAYRNLQKESFEEIEGHKIKW